MDNSMQFEFAFDQVWDAMQSLLTTQLEGVDVKPAGEKDFDDSGNLIVKPPAVRGIYAGETAVCDENQHITYDVQQKFAVICVDQHLGIDPQTQRRASARLVARVKHILTGARLQLVTGEVSEPVLYESTEPLPVPGIGMAYVAVFSVPGIAQFGAPNATPGGE